MWNLVHRLGLYCKVMLLFKMYRSSWISYFCLLLLLTWISVGSAWKSFLSGPSGSMSEYYLHNSATRASWFYVGPFNHWVDFHDSIDNRKIHGIPTESFFFTFVNFLTAFESVNQEALWWILKPTGLTEK